MWARKLADRKAGRDFRGDTYYTTAQKLARAVAALAFGVRFRGNIHETCRKHFLYTGDYDRENFGRGHVSGMRFRPRGAPPEPTHYSATGYGGPLACTPPRKATYRPENHRIARTSTKADVTCPRCLKLLAGDVV